MCALGVEKSSLSSFSIYYALSLFLSPLFLSPSFFLSSGMVHTVKRESL